MNDLRLDAQDASSVVVATELVGTSITSGADGTDVPENMKPILAENPCVRFHNSQRGYVTCDLTARALRADFRIVDYVTRPGADVRTRASFVVANGEPRAERI